MSDDEEEKLDEFDQSLKDMVDAVKKKDKILGAYLNYLTTENGYPDSSDEVVKVYLAVIYSVSKTA